MFENHDSLILRLTDAVQLLEGSYIGVVGVLGHWRDFAGTFC